MSSDLLVIVPSRGRPQNVARLLQAWEETSARADLLVCVDHDDPELDGYLDLGLAARADSDVNAWMKIGPHIGLGPTLNWYATEFCDDYFAYGFMGDDHVPRTDEWDAHILDALRTEAPRYVVAYGDDLVHGEAIPTAWFMTNDIVQRLGYAVPPTIRHLFLDNFVKTLGECLQTLVYLPYVTIEHMHPLVGKAEQDAGYVEVNSTERWNADEAAYNEYLATKFDDDVRKIRGG